MKLWFQFTAKADKEFAKLGQVLQERIVKKLDYFEQSSDYHDFSEKLAGVENNYRLRIGDYRIIFSPRSDGSLVILLVLKVGHRRDIYEEF